MPSDHRSAAPPASLVEELSELSPEELDSALEDLDEEEARQILFDWRAWARPSQLLPSGPACAECQHDPGRWFVWLNLSGRGSGKTRTGAETVREWQRQAMEAGTPIRIALVGQTSADVRDVMLNGESGLMTISPPWDMPTYLPTQRKVVWPDGTTALIFFGDSPDQLRGPQFHRAWVDELAKYQYPQETWDNLEFGLRLGDSPQAVVTTTPRPIPLIKTLLEDPMVHTTRGSSYENLSNLAPTFISRVLAKYEGTRVGRQELHAEVLTDMPGALWNYEMIETARTRAVPTMRRIVVAVDPALTAHENSDETGIIVAGLGEDRLGYVLRDLSGRYSSDGWATKVIDAYLDYEADRIVYEANNGGDLVETVLRSKYRAASLQRVHASRGKITRAEPIAALYERRLVRHHGQFPALEDQMTTYNPEAVMTVERRRNRQISPDRMDALVWALTDLMLKPQRRAGVFFPGGGGGAGAGAGATNTRR